MGFGDAQFWFSVGAILFIGAGGVHAILAVIDTWRPTWFTPIDDALREDMERSGIRFRARFPGDESRPSQWTFWLGFNVSHGVGAFVFGLFCLVIAGHDFDLVTEIGGFQALTIAISAAYFLMALRYWFWAPQAITGLATVCFVLAALL